MKPDADDGRQPIELEPLSVTPTSRYPSPSGASNPFVIDDTQAIPARPLHLCPTCSYNLTGLIERRCPECGNPFTLREAREHAFATSGPMKELLDQINTERYQAIAGVFMLCVGWYLANNVSLSFSPLSASFLRLGAITFSGVVQLLLLIAILLPGMLWKVYGDLSSARACFIMGMISIVFGFLISLI